MTEMGKQTICIWFGRNEKKKSRLNSEIYGNGTDRQTVIFNLIFLPQCSTTTLKTAILYMRYVYSSSTYENLEYNLELFREICF